MVIWHGSRCQEGWHFAPNIAERVQRRHDHRISGEIGTTIFHPVRTAKMGQNSDPMAMVDSRLKVHGVSGLRVVDASIMPIITNGNTNSPTLMIAEKASGSILNNS